MLRAMEPDLIRDTAIVVVLGGGLLLAGVPFRWAVAVLIATIALTYGVDALLDELTSEG